MRIFKTLLTVLALIGLFACSKANDKASNFDPNTGKHLAGWVAALSGGNHPEAYLRDSNSCSECHDKDLAGGISKVSCFSASRNGMNCHPGGPANHPAGWAGADSHGAAAKAIFADRNGMIHCQRCHGEDFAGGTSGKSCLNTAGCHGAGIMAAHPQKPWRSSIGGRTHSNTDASNAAACAACHVNGANSARQPAPAALPGTTPGCFNNTLCHGVPSNAPHAVPYANHNATARTNFPYCLSCHQVPQSGTVPPGCQNCHISSPVVTPDGCTSCHGNPPDGTTYPNVSDAHADHVTSTRVATLTVTCSDCHSGLGVGTIDHQVRAKARTAAGRNNPVVFSNGALIVAGGGTAPTFNDTNGQCSSTYCHGAKMPGGDISGSNRSPIWSSPFLPANITVAACTTCHGFPPSAVTGHPAVSSPTSFPLGSGCSCHANINSAGTSYANIFINKALHINGIFEQAASGTPNHPGATPVTNPVYPGALHRSVGAGYVAACGGCHDYANAGVYPSAAGTPPNCRGCHTATLGVGCSDCHGDAATGRPDGTPINAFPNRQREHRISDHINRPCTACHPFTAGDIRHGWSNRLKSTAAQVGGTGTSITNWNANTKSCLPSCHGTETW